MMFEGIAEASDEEWAMGIGMISQLADEMASGDYSKTPMLAEMMN